MMQIKYSQIVLVIITIFLYGFSAEESVQRKNEFIEYMEKKHNYPKSQSIKLLYETAKKLDQAITLIKNPKETSVSWDHYRENIFLTPSRIKQGKKFLIQRLRALNLAEKNFKVDKEIIVAILGIETFYGGSRLKHRVLDALYTHAFYRKKRSSFFIKELEEFLLLTKEENIDPILIRGSYAGAMGYPQFMPSSFRAYAASLYNNSSINIWTNFDDTIASIANYLKKHRWIYELPPIYKATVNNKISDDIFSTKIKKPEITYSELKKIGFKLKSSKKNYKIKQNTKLLPLKMEENGKKVYYLGTFNLYVISRYNRSLFYALSAALLEKQIDSNK